MTAFGSFRRPALRQGVEWTGTQDGSRFIYLGGIRFIEWEFDEDRTAKFHEFIALLAEGTRTGRELIASFPGTEDEFNEMMVALDEQGMLRDAHFIPESGMSGVTAYSWLRRYADHVRNGVRSPLYEALAEGSITQEQLIGYAIEYWHITHLCPRALAPALARDNLSVCVWQKLMNFYLTEHNHDRIMEKSIKAVGITREQLLQTQPLPATLAIMASLGVYAYNFPLALIATLFPMEEPEPEFLELFRAKCADLGLPGSFVKPIVDHSNVNEDGEHEGVTLDLLTNFSFISDEELQECGKAVADIIEQRARLDWEIMAWYGNKGGLRHFTAENYPTEAGRALTCAPLRSLA